MDPKNKNKIQKSLDCNHLNQLGRDPPPKKNFIKKMQKSLDQDHLNKHGRDTPKAQPHQA